MAIDWEGAGTGLFPRWRTMFSYLDVINAHKSVDVTNEVEAVLAGYGANLATLDENDRSANLVERTREYQEDTALNSEIRTLVEEELIYQVERDNPAEARDLQSAKAEMLRQAIRDTQTVKENIVSVAVTPPSVTGGPTVIASVVGIDGNNLERVFAESIQATPLGAQVQARGAEQQSEQLAFDWPEGSGARRSLTIVDSSGGLLANGSFDSDAIEANKPDGWQVYSGTIGTHFIMTLSEVQQIVIAGDPTSGHYTLQWTNTAGDIQKTESLAYNATGSAVQAALAALKGLENVTVTTTGDSPNFTHEINFNSVSPNGNQPILVAENRLDVGTITPSELKAGDDNAQDYRSLAFIQDGVTKHDLRQNLSGQVTPATVYAVHVQLKTDGAATGTLNIALVDGNGVAINNDAGNPNNLAVDVSTVSTSEFVPVTAFFQLPSVLPNVVQLALSTTPVLAVANLYADNVILNASQQLYTDGPYAQAFAGKRDLRSDDRWSIDVTNDRGGKMQTAIGRFLEIQMPSATSGSEVVPEY